MPGTTSTALPSFSHDQHYKTDAAKRKGGTLLISVSVQTFCSCTELCNFFLFKCCFSANFDSKCVSECIGFNVAINVLCVIQSISRIRFNDICRLVQGKGIQSVKYLALAIPKITSLGYQ